MLKVAIIAVDVQNSFLPGGELAVPDGDAVIAPLVRAAGCYPLVIATRDCHPANHCSFQPQGGDWPTHCVAGTPGSALAPEIETIASFIVNKGTEATKDAYSGFDGTMLSEILRELKVNTVVVGGLATDYCVAATARDALQHGFTTFVLVDAIRAVDLNKGDGDRALADLKKRGALFTTVPELASYEMESNLEIVTHPSPPSYRTL